MRSFFVFFCLLIIYFNAYALFDASSLLWKIQKNDEQASYIFGTIHLDINQVARFDSNIYKCLNQCDVFAAELDIGSAMDFGLMTKLLMDSGKSIKEYLSAEELVIVQSYIQDSLGMPFFMFEKIKPFFITAMVQQVKMGLLGKEPLDMQLYNHAKKANKKCIGLETIDEQLSAIDEMTIEEQVKSLLETINDDSLKIKLRGMLDYYIDQDLEKLKRLIDDEEMTMELKKKLLDDRNLRIANRISENMGKSSVFAAVGAAHLIGSEGILNHLKLKGYKISPVKIILKARPIHGENNE